MWEVAGPSQSSECPTGKPRLGVEAGPNETNGGGCSISRQRGAHTTPPCAQQTLGPVYLHRDQEEVASRHGEHDAADERPRTGAVVMWHTLRDTPGSTRLRPHEAGALSRAHHRGNSAAHACRAPRDRSNPLQELHRRAEQVDAWAGRQQSG